uniref:Uncharacterized protein n=1 Tax=Romanomermis culicivorax TaxID=13658 RepID=A0A915JT21_ROMCU
MLINPTKYAINEMQEEFETFRLDEKRKDVTRITVVVGVVVVVVRLVVVVGLVFDSVLRGVVINLVVVVVPVDTILIVIGIMTYGGFVNRESVSGLKKYTLNRDKQRRSYIILIATVNLSNKGVRRLFIICISIFLLLDAHLEKRSEEEQLITIVDSSPLAQPFASSQPNLPNLLQPNCEKRDIVVAKMCKTLPLATHLRILIAVQTAFDQ